VWVRGFVLHNQRKYDDVPAFIDEKWGVVDDRWAELITIKGNAILALRFGDPERLEEGLAVLAEARDLDPDNVNAHFFAASILLGDRRLEEGLALLERAATLSPGSATIASRRWWGIRTRRDIESDERTLLVTTLARGLLDLRGQYPATLRTVASAYRDLGLEAEATALQDRVLAEFGETADAEWVVADRWRALSRPYHEGEVEDSTAARAELRSMWWSFVNRPSHQVTALLGEAYQNLFADMTGDDAVPADTLLLVARGAAEHERLNPGFHARLAIGVAERGVHLDEARGLARGGLDAAEEFMSERMDMFDTAGEAADFLDWIMAEAYAAVGFVETKAGDLDAARSA
jgi:hypothetical protein